ncbi:protein phosphatase 2C domain-containing protein [Sulfitobacter sp. D35]|uniref:PP2C family protein-serine/threonine phosphatase n=1 Tax=Sulfitobacter sp. D35 TaxID=3083252 RepID=UPI00296FC20E|nr:protein phosphatase 2C domain-containing protein [Sulfitobacter sp. D35]MDW4497158.1 protein phosphatase 2C domain-containing protein [Sulfitobacter sp. D35]
MRERQRYSYDASPAICVGGREQQEDAIAMDFAEGADFGFIVLADGMGGHSAGDVASKIVVTEVFSELKMLADQPELLERNFDRILRKAVAAANECVARIAQDSPGSRGMGATLIAPVVFDNRLYWISVGDSPLYLLRGSRLFRLNEEHSFASRMSKLVAKGQLDPEVAEQHPDRNCLTSVLGGQAIPEIDCRSQAVELRENDIVIAASDGLQFIGEWQIARIAFEARDLPSAEIGKRLLQSVYDLDDPDQDNVSLCVLKISKREIETPFSEVANLASCVPLQKIESATHTGVQQPSGNRQALGQ